MAGIALLVSIAAVSAFAHGPGWGWGHGQHMMDSWNRGGAYGNLTDEQRNELSRLDRKYFNETADLRNKLWTKESELQTILNSPNPDIDKAKAVQKEISDLRAKLDEKRIEYETDVRKVAPDTAYGYYGHHMGGYGPMMGYGPGACWN
jgi:zinc resistance-associated protein